MIDRFGNKERFCSLLRMDGREGVEELIAWLEETDFFDAPASTRFHLCEPGGLCRHSLNVYDEAVRLSELYGDACGDGSVVIAALLHDLCKIGCYKGVTRSRKNADGVWESYQTYEFAEDFPYGGHGAKSVWLASKYIRLTDEEAVAIHCHMGMSDCDDARKIFGAYDAHPFAWLIHVADEAATFVTENPRV